jgi:death on curing protein
VSAPRWLSPEDGTAIHDLVLELSGGPAGTRDPGGLASALARARWTWRFEPGGRGVARWAKAAAVHLIGVARAHAFVDGNKRAGYATAVAFLAVNGWRLRAKDGDVVPFVVEAAQGHVPPDVAADWFRTRMSKVREAPERPRARPSRR